MRFFFVFILLLAFSCENSAQRKALDKLENENVALTEQVKGLQMQVSQLQSERDKNIKTIDENELLLKKLKRSAQKRSSSEVRQSLGLKKDQKLYATLKTSLGDMVAELFVDQAPNTVAHFVGFSEGTLAWIDPNTHQEVTRPLYSNLLFHRVMPNFMIQSGDPLGTGLGGPGYTFDDEFAAELHHDQAGIMSMANRSEPNSNGSQFFILDKAMPHLDGRHSIFGKVIRNLKLVKDIATLKTNAANRPLEPVFLKEVRIGRGVPKP